MAEHEPRLREVDALLDAAAIQLDEALVVLDRVRDDLDADPAAVHGTRAQARPACTTWRASTASRPSSWQRAARHCRANWRPARRRRAPAGSSNARSRRQPRMARSGRRGWRKPGDMPPAQLAAATTALIAELGMGGGRFEIAHRAERSRTARPAGRRARGIPGLRQRRPAAAAAAQGRLRRRTVAHLAGDRSRRAGPGRGADHGLRRSRLRHRRRGRRHRRPEAARAGRASARCCA